MNVLVPEGTFLFEGFRFDRRAGGLFRVDGKGVAVTVPLGARALDVLGVLIARPGDIVSKDEITAAVWHGRIVEDSNLPTQISALRRVLDRDRTQGSCIQTVPGRGYRFVVPVRGRDQSALSGILSPFAGRAPEPPRLSIVVLPFANLSGDPQQQYFADGITEDLTTDLSRLAGMLVISCNTAFIYLNTKVGTKQIGRELGVRYVLAGSVRRSANKVRVTAQLIDAETDTHLWAERFGTYHANPAEAQIEITGRIARTLNFVLVKEINRRLEREQVTDPNSQELTICGWSWFYRSLSAENRKKAWQAFERALQMDSESLEARIGLAMILVTNVAIHWSACVSEDEEYAERLLTEALERDANRSMAHHAMGILRRLQSRLAEAQSELETAIALDLSNASALDQLGLTLMWLGQPQRAITCVQKGIRLSPHDPEISFAYSVLGMCYLLQGQVEDAIGPLRKARAANPRLYYTHMNLAAALGFAGEVDEAREILAESFKIRPEFSSLAQLRLALPWTRNLKYLELAENTFEVGLRKAGMSQR